MEKEVYLSKPMDQNRSELQHWYGQFNGPYFDTPLCSFLPIQHQNIIWEAVPTKINIL